MEFMDRAADYGRKHPRMVIVTETFEYEGETITRGMYRLPEESCDCGYCNPKLTKAFGDKDA